MSNDLLEQAKKCALYDFDTIEMVECKWALWQDIINALSPASTAGWQPIETAPDNGDFILGYQEGRIQETVAWDRERKFWMNGYDDKPCHPTHWKPLDNGPVSRPMQRAVE